MRRIFKIVHKIKIKEVFYERREIKIITLKSNKLISELEKRE